MCGQKVGMRPQGVNTLRLVRPQSAPLLLNRTLTAPVHTSAQDHLHTRQAQGTRAIVCGARDSGYMKRITASSFADGECGDTGAGPTQFAALGGAHLEDAQRHGARESLGRLAGVRADASSSGELHPIYGLVCVGYLGPVSVTCPECRTRTAVKARSHAHAACPALSITGTPTWHVVSPSSRHAPCSLPSGRTDSAGGVVVSRCSAAGACVPAGPGGPSSGPETSTPSGQNARCESAVFGQDDVDGGVKFGELQDGQAYGNDCGQPGFASPPAPAAASPHIAIGYGHMSPPGPLTYVPKLSSLPPTTSAAQTGGPRASRDREDAIEGPREKQAQPAPAIVCAQDSKGVDIATRTRTQAGRKRRRMQPPTKSKSKEIPRAAERNHLAKLQRASDQAGRQTEMPELQMPAEPSGTLSAVRSTSSALGPEEAGHKNGPRRTCQHGILAQASTSTSGVERLIEGNALRMRRRGASNTRADVMPTRHASVARAAIIARDLRFGFDRKEQGAG
ncbi:hypothetical protein WOLCODRAFT_146332 [Wolfiporia cocos MD-104 SS10]|uniref:Uncharacterized protein n=1 Tax=Wolfiporia cocos (strain MD-104) TaxID=742152 RepID=A0A2H3JKU5_WOLCO|nr:hypothetical protein WOLCODRAFT_146332 [Wolfiporia cocos MD-104 SS10]